MDFLEGVVELLLAVGEEVSVRAQRRLDVEVAEAPLYVEQVRSLVDDRPFQYDVDAGVVLDLSSLRDNPPGKRRGDPHTWPADSKPDKRVVGAIRQLKGLPKTKLLRQLYVIAGQYSPDLAEAMLEEFPHLEDVEEDPYKAPLHAAFDAPSRKEKGSDEERGGEAPLSVAEIAAVFNAETVRGSVVRSVS